MKVSAVDRTGNKYRASAARKNAGMSPKNLTGNLGKLQLKLTTKHSDLHPKSLVLQK